MLDPNIVEILMARRAAYKPLPRSRNGRPYIRTTDDVVDYYIDRLLTRNPIGTRGHDRERMSSMFYEGDTLYHYGHHFWLARAVRTPQGAVRHVMLNNERWRGSSCGFGPSTADRQWQIRHAVEAAGFRYYLTPTDLQLARKREMNERYAREFKAAFARCKRELLSFHAGRLRECELPLGDVTARFILKAICFTKVPAVPLLNWNVERACIGPVRDYRRIVVRDILHHYIYHVLGAYDIIEKKGSQWRPKLS